MSQLVRAAELVYILLPARSANGVGDLLYRALRRLGAWPVKYGTLTDLPAMLDILLTQPVRCLVGVPAQVLALAKYYAAKQETRKVPLKNILLCTDHVPRAIKREIESIWGCPVFDYYGMTEAGYGGGMECPARSGYHLHEADLYFEIVGPVSGRPVPAGQEGEIVLTTLTRRGMPLIRYRTGDISRFVLEPCPCGTAMRRLEKIRGRKNGLTPVGACGFLAMSDLDEVLFPLPGVVDFTAEIQRLENKTRLTLLVHTLRPGMEEHAVRQALDSLSAVRDALAAQILELAVEFSVVADVFPASSGKRQIIPIPN
jgi:phenylacetate-coenzyme A ligase PaaK-like adenylate-forming protein